MEFTRTETGKTVNMTPKEVIEYEIERCPDPYSGPVERQEDEIRKLTEIVGEMLNRMGEYIAKQVISDTCFFHTSKEE